MKTALVTGCTGFIGGHLGRALVKAGWTVRASLRDQAGAARLPPGVAPFVVGDLSAGPDWTSALDGADTVFHVAGLAHDTAHERAAAEFVRVNVEATRGLLKAAGAAGARRFVFFSSVAAEGAATPYGRSKRDAEKDVLAAGGVCLRLPLVYGPGQKGNLERLARTIARGFFPALAWVQNRRSFAHVDNVVQAALLAAESPKAAGQTYVVTDARPYATAEICRLLREGLGKPRAAWDIPRPMLRGLAALGDALGRLRGRPFPFDSTAYEKLCGDLVFDSGKIARELGYRPTAELPAAIAGIVDGLRR